MSRRREIEERLALYHELADIMRAMKNMAQAELHRISRREALQERCLQAVEQAAGAFLRAWPATIAGATIGAIYVAIGSERGFCGGFNEGVLRSLDVLLENNPPAGLIVVGERLAGRQLASERYRPVRVAGATTESEVAGVLNTVVDAFTALQSRNPLLLGLRAIYNSGHEVSEAALIPLPGVTHAEPSRAALALRLNVPPREFLSELQRQYVYHALLAVLYTSLKVENRMRLAQMEGALHHLEESTQRLKLRQNALRQEEIVQEIESIFSAPAEAAP